MKTLISTKYPFVYQGMERLWFKCWSNFIKDKETKYTKNDGDIDGKPSYNLNIFISKCVKDLIVYFNKHNVRILLNHFDDLDNNNEIMFNELFMDIGLDIGCKIYDVLDTNKDEYVDLDTIEDLRDVLSVFMDECFKVFDCDTTAGLYKALHDELVTAADKLGCVGFILDTSKPYGTCAFHGIELTDLNFVISVSKDEVGNFKPFNFDLYTNKDYLIVADGNIVHYIKLVDINKYNSIKIYKYKPEIINKIKES